MKNISDDLVDFIVRTEYTDLPADVIHEAKRSLLDALGCAVAGLATDKGKIAVSISKRLGGPAESSILGIGDKVSCANAAMANGELVNGLDFDAISHIHPFTIPPTLAVAEAIKATGKDLILSTVLAQEVAKRFILALSNMLAKLTEEAKTPDVFGNSNECIFGATAGVSKLLELGEKELAHALGISAYLCPLPVCRDWEDAIPKSMIKYVSAGWICQTSVTASLLAKEGYTGNPHVFDGEYGFARFYGAERWTPEIIVDGLGEQWRFMEMAYKPYPCCRFFHAQLDAFIKIIETNNIQPNDIESVKTYALPFVANTAPYDVQTQVDAQFSLPYVFSAAAHRVKIGAAWQDWETIRDPNIRGFMKKVTMVADPRIMEIKRKDPRSWPAKVEVTAFGKTFTEEVIYARGTNFTDLKASDEELVDKFKRNANRFLTKNKVDKTVESIFGLEKVSDVRDLISTLVL